MIIRQLELKNWGPYKGYHRIDFPEPTATRRIHLIRGENGNGKTHLLRAMVICLHGERGMDIVEPVRIGSHSDRTRLNDFLKSALSHGADEDGTGPQLKLAVTLYDGEKEVKVTRSWWFEGRDDEPEEELALTIDGKPFAPYASSKDEVDDEKQALIQSLIPKSVTKFFFFDGEEIKSIAERDPQQAVSEGLDALLGFQLLTDLQKDIGKQRTEITNALASSRREHAELQRIDAEISRLEADRIEVDGTIKDKKREIEQFEASRQALRRKLPGGSSTASSSAQSKLNLIDEKKRLQADHDNAARQLGDAVGGDLSLALNSALVTSTLERLAGERNLRTWKSQREELEPQCEKLNERLLGRAAPQPTPALTEEQRAFLQDRLRAEWKLILHPPPDGVPSAEWFSDFSSDALIEAERRLRSVSNAPDDRVSALVQTIRDLDRSVERLQERIENYDDDETHRGVLQQIEELSQKIGSLEREIGENADKLEQLDEDIAARKRDRSLRLGKHGKADELTERLRVTDDLDAVITDFREKLKFARIEDLEESIQQMMVKLAHKGDDQFNRIEIDPKTFRLVVLDADRNEVEKPSAGEQEILALSMIWALGRISRRDLPLVIDTPLGRLDRRHRDNIVNRFLPEGANQVIVLATDAEITDERRHALAGAMAGEFELVFDTSNRETKIQPMEPLQ